MNAAETPRPTLGEILRRALRLRCPRCGQRRLFYGWFQMHDVCPHCKLKYERGPGYFLGSAYIGYGVLAITLIAAYMALRYGAGFTNRTLAAPLTAYAVVFALIFFRYARSLWLGMDYFLDPTGFDPATEDSPPSDEQPAPTGRPPE